MDHEKVGMQGSHIKKTSFLNISYYLLYVYNYLNVNPIQNNKNVL